MKLQPHVLAVATVFVWSSAIPVARRLIESLDFNDSSTALPFIFALLGSAFAFFFAWTIARHRRLPRIGAVVAPEKSTVWIVAQAVILPSYLYCYYRAVITGPPVEMHTIIYCWPLLMVVASPLLNSLVRRGVPVRFPPAYVLLVLATAFLASVYMLAGQLTSLNATVAASAAVAAALLIGLTFSITTTAMVAPRSARSYADNAEFYCLSIGLALVPIGFVLLFGPEIQLKTFPFLEVFWLGAGVFGFGHLCWTTALSPERLAFFKSEPEDVAVLSYFTPMVTAGLLGIAWGMPLPPGTGVALVVILVCAIILNSRRVRVEPSFLGILGALAATLLAELTTAASSSPSAAVQASLTGLTFLFGLVATFFMQRVAQQNAEMETSFANASHALASARRILNTIAPTIPGLFTINREIGSTLSLLRESLRSGEFRSEDLQDRILAATRKCRRWEKRVSDNASVIALVEALSVSAAEIENFARNYCRDPIPRSNVILLWLLATLTLMQSSLSVGEGIYQRGGNAVFAGGVFYIVGLLQDGAFGIGGDRRFEAFGVAGIAQASRSNWAVVSELSLVGVILVLLFR